MGEMILNFFTVVGMFTVAASVFSILWIAFIDGKGEDK